LEVHNVTRSKNGMAGRLTGAVAVSAALLVPLAVFGAPALARSGAAASQQGSASSQYQYRVVICHVTKSKKHPAHTITVSSAAVAAHLRHGDHLGACTATETPRAKNHGKGHDQNTGSTTKPNQGNEHGQGNDQGKGDEHGKGHHK
jgi:hypothetical protein